MKRRRELARERIRILLSEAFKTAVSEPERAQRYVKLASRIASKARVRIPRELRRRICRSCCTPLIPGVTARYRLRGVRRLTVTCLICGYTRRYPLNPR